VRGEITHFEVMHYRPGDGTPEGFVALARTNDGNLHWPMRGPIRETGEEAALDFRRIAMTDHGPMFTGD
jgi:hypothetical protein